MVPLAMKPNHRLFPDGCMWYHCSVQLKTSEEDVTALSVYFLRELDGVDIDECRTMAVIHSDEGLTLETSVLESFTVANFPYGLRG